MCNLYSMTKGQKAILDTSGPCGDLALVYINYF